MIDPAKIEAWASRYLDLWERHLAAENEYPTAQGGRKSLSGQSDRTPDRTDTDRPGQDGTPGAER